MTSREPTSRDFHNPWRASLENCITGDNYLRTSELQQLIEEIDDLYRYRCGQHSALQDAYANGREDEAEARDAEVAALTADLARKQAALAELVTLKDAPPLHGCPYCSFHPTSSSDFCNLHRLGRQAAAWEAARAALAQPAQEKPHA